VDLNVYFANRGGGMGQLNNNNNNKQIEESKRICIINPNSGEKKHPQKKSRFGLLDDEK
jgi:hypothetical protein